jgi:hypothetical protein
MWGLELESTYMNDVKSTLFNGGGIGINKDITKLCKYGKWRVKVIY